MIGYLSNNKIEDRLYAFRESIQSYKETQKIKMVAFYNDLNADHYDTDMESIPDDETLDMSQESVFDEILDKEEEYKDQQPDPPPIRYAIGLHWLNRPYPTGNTQLLVASTILAKHWFDYPFEDILHYLRNYTIVHLAKANIEIMKVCEQPDFSMAVLLKTHWLRLVQRTWRNVVNRRDELRYSFYAKHNDRLSYTLKGMLSGLCKAT